MKIICAVGARPNFIKLAPLYAALKKDKRFDPVIVYTGQHYDRLMSQIFFNDFDLPKPRYFLNIGSGSHAEQTAGIMTKFEKALLKEKPELVIVVGDVNSTIACALCSAKIRIPVAHVEAGLRSFDMSMPEEVNRCLTDRVSDFLFVSEPAGIKNLLNEGMPRKKIFLVGNVMIDALIASRSKIEKSKILEKLRLRKEKYAVLTLHRPVNVDNPIALKRLLCAFLEIQNKIKIIFPVHPRTGKALGRLRTRNCKNLMIIEPLGYFDFLSLVSRSKFVLTDSGGVQVEASFLRIPCLTLRDVTEHPVTIAQGTNTLCGNDRDKIIKVADNILKGKYKKRKAPRLWDGKASERIAEILGSRCLE